MSLQKVNVTCAGGNYSILTGRQLLRKVGTLAKSVLRPNAKVLIVSNRKVASLFLKPVMQSFKSAGYETYSFLLPNGNERDKSNEILIQLWKKMVSIPLERSSAIVALGGGVVGDAAGFAASTYMRGIPVIQVPTTLLAQVDSSIGGKTAVNLPDAKNVVGTFYQPVLVVSDVETLKTLPLEQVSHQFAEIIKYGVIQDKALFQLLEKKIAGFFKKLKAKQFGKEEIAFLQKVISHSAKVKAHVVSADERETKGRRMILNYGHTFGHGFESASGYKMSHGNAVALGMLCAGRLAVQLGLWSQRDEERQTQLIQALPGLKNLRTFSLKTEKIIHSMARDKKKKDGRLRFVLPTKIGKVIVRNDISTKQIREVIEGALKR